MRCARFAALLAAAYLATVAPGLPQPVRVEAPPLRPSAPDIGLDAAQLMRDVEALAADEMQGRRTGTPGGDMAREYVRRRFKEIGLPPFGKGYDYHFTFVGRGDQLPREGTNLLGLIRGTARPDRLVVVTAHYDHIGIQRDGQVFNGADDNATGVAALFAIASHFLRTPPATSIVIAAVDAEESGMRGSRAMLERGVLPRQAVVMNVNIDMIGRDAANVLYVAGPFHYPQLTPLLQNIAQPPVELRLGHDRSGQNEDWTRASDHVAFHELKIPFVYFGVEDVAHHHKVTDDAATIEREFFAGAVRTIVAALTRFTSELR